MVSLFFWKEVNEQMTLIKYVPQATFLAPDGVYRAQVVDVREYQKPEQGGMVDMVRVVFDIMDDSGSYVQYKAGKNYLCTLAVGSELRRDLVNWGLLTVDQRGDFDPSSLKGKQADIVIKQIRNDNHAQPYCAIKAIFSAGTMTKTVVAPKIAA